VLLLCLAPLAPLRLLSRARAKLCLRRPPPALPAQVLTLVDQLTAGAGADKPWRVFVTGHSLGGALATLCAYELAGRRWAAGGGAQPPGHGWGQAVARSPRPLLCLPRGHEGSRPSCLAGSPLFAGLTPPARAPPPPCPLPPPQAQDRPRQPADQHVHLWGAPVSAARAPWVWALPAGPARRAPPSQQPLSDHCPSRPPSHPSPPPHSPVSATWPSPRPSMSGCRGAPGASPMLPTSCPACLVSWAMRTVGGRLGGGGRRLIRALTAGRRREGTELESDQTL
jgi:hypothetical protein